MSAPLSKGALGTSNVPIGIIDCAPCVLAAVVIVQFPEQMIYCTRKLAFLYRTIGSSYAWSC
jgi:hypothetical protein